MLQVQNIFIWYIQIRLEPVFGLMNKIIIFLGLSGGAWVLQSLSFVFLTVKSPSSPSFKIRYQAASDQGRP